MDMMKAPALAFIWKLKVDDVYRNGKRDECGRNCGETVKKTVEERL
jgi:hypothetical protein